MLMGEPRRGPRWWFWLIVVVAFFVGLSVGRAGPSSEDRDMALLMVDTLEDMAGTMGKAAESQDAERRAHLLWIEVMDSEIAALDELRAEFVEFPEALVELDAAIAAAEGAGGDTHYRDDQGVRVVHSVYPLGRSSARYSRFDAI